jgi:hypothetical protein
MRARSLSASGRARFASVAAGEVSTAFIARTTFVPTWDGEK